MQTPALVSVTPNKLYRLVRHENVLDYLKCGWHIAETDIGLHHSYYSVLLSWICQCQPVEPLNERHPSPLCPFPAS